MKRVSIALAALLALAACGPKKKSAAPPAPSKPAAQAPARAPGAPSGPLPGLALLRDFYKPTATPYPDSPAKDPFFTEDLARAIKKDTSKKGEVGAIDFDYRYGAQDLQITEVEVSANNTLDGEQATARFNNMGKPYEVDYRLTLTRAGWRIEDISAPAQQGDTAWDLRTMLKLPPPGSEAPHPP